MVRRIGREVKKINKHTMNDLKQMSSLPLDIKINMSKRRIQEWYEYWQGNVYVSFSGGKDSTVLKHIIDSMYVDVPAVFINTGLEYPEIQHFVRNIKADKYSCFNTDVEIVTPKMPFNEVIKKYGYPVVSKEVSEIIDEAKKNISKGKKIPDYRMKKLNGQLLDKNGNKSRYNCEKWKFLLDADFKISNKCCNIMKKLPIKTYEKESLRKPFIGTMAAESLLRQNAWIRYGCNSFVSSRPRSAPLSFWTEQDILNYIIEYKVPYSSIYGNIIPIDEQISMIEIDKPKLKMSQRDRTGCMFCMFGCHLEKEPNRFQKLKASHPNVYNYCINGGEYNEKGIWQPSKEGLGIGHVLDFIGGKY